MTYSKVKFISQTDNIVFFSLFFFCADKVDPHVVGLLCVKARRGYRKGPGGENLKTTDMLERLH